jgi:hypothetical protein
MRQRPGAEVYIVFLGVSTPYLCFAVFVLDLPARWACQSCGRRTMFSAAVSPALVRPDDFQGQEEVMRKLPSG